MNAPFPPQDWLDQILKIIGSLWLQNIILAVTATIGLGSYIFSARSQRRRDTVDALLRNLNDKEADAALTHVHALVRARLDIPHLLSQAGIADRRIILSVLNRYEFMASGLKMRAFDRTVYKRMYYSSVVQDWKDLRLFVRQYRDTRGIPTAYQDIEGLFEDWESHPLRVSEKRKRPEHEPTDPR